ncbi:MAG: tetratricopeptide repeat protein [Candidatus Omnitrophota bacterium]|nr:tetratricopeptide repeat protein [Candidatus Omnitrophota bacterium]
MLKLLLILSLPLLMLNTSCFAEEDRIITPLDKIESHAAKIEDSLNRTEEQIERLNQSELSVSSFEADQSDKLEEKEEADANYNKLFSYYLGILDSPKSTKAERLNALREIAKVKLRQHRFEDLIQICRRLLYKYPQELSILETIAEADHLCASQYLSEGRYDDAIRKYEVILDLKNVPTEWYAFTKDYIASLYLLKKEPDKALYWYRKIISEHPDLKHWPASAHYSIAQYYLGQNNYRKAEEELQMIIKDHPDSDWAKPALDKLRSFK